MTIDATEEELDAMGPEERKAVLAWNGREMKDAEERDAHMSWLLGIHCGFIAPPDSWEEV